MILWQNSNLFCNDHCLWENSLLLLLLPLQHRYLGRFQTFSSRINWEKSLQPFKLGLPLREFGGYVLNIRFGSFLDLVVELGDGC